MSLLVPLALGVVTVIQAALNRRISLAWGLLPAALLNASVFFVLTALALTWARTGTGPFAALLARSLDTRDVRFWWLLPGLFGFAIVLGLPWAIQRLGALQTFVFVVAAQMLASAVWDHYAEGIAVDARRVIGALLAVAGAVLVGFKR